MALYLGNDLITLSSGLPVTIESSGIDNTVVEQLINEHNTNSEAHADIREAAEQLINEHNISNETHTDIREAINTVSTNLNNLDIRNSIKDDTTSKLYVLGATTIGKTDIYRESSVYMQNNVLLGAAWNDYAEYRAINEMIEPGRVVKENGDDTLSLATERLQPGCEIVTDTFGFAIGKSEFCNTPIAVSGRVLAYSYEDRNSYMPGDAVCSGPNGTISKMTRDEIQKYPERIIGTVSAIPNYKIWGENDIAVNGRIWIRIR